MNPEDQLQLMEVAKMAKADMCTVDLDQYVRATDDTCFVTFCRDFNSSWQATVFFNAYPVMITNELDHVDGETHLLDSDTTGHGEALLGFCRAVGMIGDMGGDFDFGPILTELVEKPWEAVRILSSDAMDDVWDDGHELCELIDHLISLRPE